MTNFFELMQKYNPMNNRPASTADIAFATGVITEQERIIKLLDESDSACSGWAIALIKGENNG
jgi:hypothetical protein